MNPACQGLPAQKPQTFGQRIDSALIWCGMMLVFAPLWVLCSIWTSRRLDRPKDWMMGRKPREQRDDLKCLERAVRKGRTP